MLANLFCPPPSFRRRPESSKGVAGMFGRAPALACLLQAGRNDISAVFRLSSACLRPAGMAARYLAIPEAETP